MKKLRIIAFAAGFLGLALLNSNCGKMKTGVCTGYSEIFNKTYCYDGWTEEDCDDYNDNEVNGATWYFYKGQTCSERGTPASN